MSDTRDKLSLSIQVVRAAVATEPTLASRHRITSPCDRGNVNAVVAELRVTAQATYVASPGCRGGRPTPAALAATRVLQKLRL